MTKPRVLAAVTLGHLAIDVFNSMGPVLVAFLRLPLQLPASRVGLAVGLYQFLAGATQPAFGWLVDRVGSRIVGPLSVVLTLGCVCLAIGLGLHSGSYWIFLAFFALAAVGSGAFHPQGTMHAGTPEIGSPATTTAVFFLFGQVGLASGPALAGLALDQLGPTGIYSLAVVLLPVPIFMALAMGSARHNPPPAGRYRIETETPRARPSLELRPIALLTVIFACRAWVYIGTAAFLPLLFQVRGWSSTRQGVITGLFWLGGAMAGVVAGAVADRVGRRAVVATTTLLGSLLLLVLPLSQGPQALVTAVLCGALLGAPHSVLMVLAQALLPVRQGLASGAALGFLFASGAMASWAIGLLADRYELALVLQAGALLGGAAALLSLLLPASRVSEPERARPATLNPVALELPGAKKDR